MNGVKKSRESRLINRVGSPISIKVEDDSDEDSVEPRKNFGNSSGKRVDKSVQTEDTYLMEVLKTIVKDRMEWFRDSIVKDELRDRNLSPMLEKLQRENEELRNQAMALKTQLEVREKLLPGKRRYSAIEHQLQSKRNIIPPPLRQSASTEVCPPTTMPRLSNSPIASRVSALDINMPRLSHPPVVARAPEPEIATSRLSDLVAISRVPVPDNLSRSSNSAGVSGLSAPVANAVIPRANQVRYLGQTPEELVSTSEHFMPPQLGHPRPPFIFPQVRQNPPAQQIQSMMRHPYNPNEGFVVVNKPIPAVNMNEVTPLVDASNLGKRVTSAPPEVAMLRPPIDAHGRTFGNTVPPNVSINAVAPSIVPSEISNQYKQLMDLQRMPINGLNSRPIHNTVRPFKPIQNQPTVPNLAHPFSPLPRLSASITTTNNAIVLTWDYERSGESSTQYKVECYQLFAHQAKDLRAKPPLDTRQWKKIGVVNALPLPMACTLTQFATGSVYYFAVVAVDIHGREGEMSNACVIRLDVNR